MKLIIAGSRHLDISKCLLMDLLLSTPVESKLTEFVFGACPTGIDRLALDLATEQYENTPIIEFPADWNKNGKAAGPIRNREMAQYGDALLVIWDGESRGSKNMKEEMLKLNKPVYEVILRKYNV